MTYRSRKIDQLPLGKFLKENFGKDKDLLLRNRRISLLFGQLSKLASTLTM